MGQNVVRFLDQASQSRAGPGVTIFSRPSGRNGRSLSGQLRFESCGSDGFGEVVQESGLEVSVRESNVTKAECEIYVLVLLNQILDSEEEGLQGIFDHVTSEGGSGCDRHGVGVDASESLLEN